MSNHTDTPEPNDGEIGASALVPVLNELAHTCYPCVKCGSDAVAIGAGLCQMCRCMFYLPRARFCLRCYHSEPDNAVCEKCQDTLVEGLPDYDA